MSLHLQTHTFTSGQVLELVQGDITQEPLDAIVNAANERLMHGGGVAAIIARQGGKVVDQESHAWVKQHGPVSHDRPAFTSGGNLPARYIIHAVGPVWGSGDEDRKLQAAIRGSLRVGEELGLTSIAFPAISTGIFGFPKARAARLFFQTIQAYFTQNPLSRLRLIRLTLFDQPTLMSFSEEFARYFHPLVPPGWKIVPLAEARIRLSFHRNFTPDEFNRLQKGFIPKEMEDKWFIFFEDNWLNFHRSWTGICIYRLHLTHKENDYQVDEAWANRDPAQYTNTDSEQDIRTIHTLINGFLLAP